MVFTLSLPAPNGVPWSEYVRTQRNRSRSVSSSTEALESDHARYITRRIAQHARSMATGTRSIPTDSPIPYFQPIERGLMSECRLSDLDSQEGVYASSLCESIGTDNKYQVVLITILMLLKQIEYLPIQD